MQKAPVSANEGLTYLVARGGIELATQGSSILEVKCPLENFPTQRLHRTQKEKGVRRFLI